MDRGAFVRLCVGTAFGIPLGILLLRIVPRATASTVLGVLLVLYGVYALIPTAPTGTVSMPVVVYGTLRGWAPPVFRGTLQAHFLFSGVLVVAGQALGGLWTAELPRLFALSIPAIGVATVAGHRLHAGIKPHPFERAVYILVAVLGLVLTIRGRGRDEPASASEVRGLRRCGSNRGTAIRSRASPRRHIYASSSVAGSTPSRRKKCLRAAPPLTRCVEH